MAFILLIVLYLLLPLMPLFLFLQGSDANIPLSTLVSRTAGIYAFVWYSLQFILTARTRFLEWLIPRDRRLILHMLTAAGLLGIVLIHTGFGEKYVSKLQAGLGGTAETIFLWATLFSGLFFSNYFVRFLPGFIPYRDKISSLLKLSYEKCLLLHYAMPPGMVLLIAHVVLIPGQGFGIFKACMVMIGCSTLSVFLYHKMIVPKIRQRYPWRVNKVVPESETVVTLFFDPPPGKTIKHRAGQFCYIRPLDRAMPSQSHPFTISSAPDDKLLSITVKQLGDFTAKMKEIKRGSLVCIDGAYGDFSHDRVPEGRTLIFIAGGIGITPMLSMLQDLSVKDPMRKVILVWGVRYAADLIRLNEIEAITKQMEHLAFEPVLSREQEWEGRRGRIDKNLLDQVLNLNGISMDNQGDCEFFICGPGQMNADMLQVLKEKKIPGRAIHTEQFSF